jgi:hypothetical protein
MTNDRSTPSRSNADTIDYEITDIADARTAHDSFPPGIDEFGRMQPGYWEQRRRAPLPTDRALTGLSLVWLIQLPEPLRPNALRDGFPRIVNALSESWSDDARSLAFFARLLNDRRPGRRGFPAEVQRELESLCEYRIELVSVRRAAEGHKSAVIASRSRRPAGSRFVETRS